MSARNYAKEMAYLEWMYYGPGQRFLSPQDKNFSGHSWSLTKGDVDVTTSTTGVYNAVYGAFAWIQTNHESNAFGVLPKYSFDKSGWRVITADAGSAADGGVSQNGAVPSTAVPTWLEVSALPKTEAHSFGNSEVQEAIALSGDDATGDMDALRRYFASLHKLRINEQLLRDVDSTADTRFESIDRIASGSTEASLVTSNDVDIYGVDRDSAGWADAYVDQNSNVDRDLTDTLLVNALDNTREAGANSSVWLTGTDTYAATQILFEPQVRYQTLKESRYQLTPNGIETPNGIDLGLTFATLYGIPMVISASTVKDTISRVYLLDTSDPEGSGYPRLGMRINKPTQYFETGINKGDPFAIDKFGNQGVYRTMGELIAYRFDVQGKIRDLR